MKQFIFISAILLLVSQAHGQRRDCATALNIDKKVNISFSLSPGSGEEEELEGALCDPSLAGIQEVQSYWITWTAYSAGSFTFNISPTAPNTNLDFIVYELDGDCTSKTPVRCLLSGPSMIGSNNCTGDVGLDPSSADEVELPGCDGGNDNFLAPLYLEEEKQYALVINNISQTPQSVQLTFCGEALLGPDDSACELLTNNATVDVTLSTPLFFPNPATNRLILTSELTFEKVFLFDINGKVVASYDTPRSAINIGKLPSGVYVFSGLHKGELVRQKFIKQ